MLWGCEWLPVRLVSVSAVLCSITLSSAVTTGRGGLETAGRLFTLVVVFSLFVVVQSWFKGFVSADKGSDGTDWGPPRPVCSCRRSSTQTACAQKKHPLAAAYFSPSDGRLLGICVFLSASRPEGSPANKGKHACFCLGCRPQAIPPSRLYPE